MRKPKYRRHRRKGLPDLALVELNGRRFYLGEYGSAESKVEYNRHIAEWEARGRKPLVRAEEITVTELCDRFLEHAEVYYRHSDGRQTSEVANFRTVIARLREYYGRSRARDFRPLALETFQSELIGKDLGRTTVNATVRKVRRIFKWGVRKQLVPSSVLEGLRCVPDLKRGRSPARETRAVKPVPAAHVNALEPYLSRQAWALVRLMLLTGMRPGEAVQLRPADVDRTGRCWLYTPRSHKTEHHGHVRTVALGPEAQKVLKPFLVGRAPGRACFSPREAKQESRARRRAERRTPENVGNRPGTNRKRRPRRRPADQYSVDSLGRAIRRACESAKVPKWSPHRLRHNAATEIRRRYGLEVARAVLGHKSAVVTELYAELDMEAAKKAMREIG